MLYLIISTTIGIVLFLCAFLGFQQGLRLGMRATKGIEPQPVRNPIQFIKDIKQDIEMSKEAKEELSELAKMFAYNGDVPKEED